MVARLPTARRSSMPTRIAPQLARPTPEPPAGAGWVHEIKHDGHRTIAYLDRGRVRLETRAGNDATRRFSPIAELLTKLPVRSAILDGEIAVPDERGVTHIALLDNALRGRGGPLVFYAFDLMFLDSLDRRRCCLPDRKAALAEVLARSPERVLLSEHLTCDGRALFEKVGELGGEGIVSKRIGAPYTSGPSSTWLKTKHSAIGTFPVIGYVPNGPRIEALLVAERSPSMRLIGRVEFRRPGVLDEDAHEALAFLARPKPCIPVARPERGVRWVEPRLIATVKHFGRTGSGALRAGVLQGLAVE
jgi:bifunctional non-homologous end joining protein LigD